MKKHLPSEVNNEAVMNGSTIGTVIEDIASTTVSGTLTDTGVDNAGNVVSTAKDSSPYSGFMSGTTYSDTVNIHDVNATAYALTFTSAEASTPTAPALSAIQTLDGVTNLGVDSALVIAFDQSITLKSGHIKIYDDMGASGWVHSNQKAGESIKDTYDNDVDITLLNSHISSVLIGGVDYTSRFNLSTSVQAVGNNLVIDLKQLTPSTKGAGTFSTTFDWDFGSNYHVNFDAGIVQNINGTGNSALGDSTTLNFTTVTPVDTITGAVASSVMDSKGGSTALSSGYKWLNGNQSGNDGALPMVNLDLSGGAYAVVVDTKGGTTKASNLSAYVNLKNFNSTDILYNDNHGDMRLSTTDGLTAASWYPSTIDAFSLFPTGAFRSTASPLASGINFEGFSYSVTDALFENQRIQANSIVFG